MTTSFPIGPTLLGVDYRSANDLRRQYESGEPIEFEGLFLELGSWSEIYPGDTYLGRRNQSGIKLLTCKEVNKEKWWVVPIEKCAYIFDLHDCYKVRNFDEALK